MHIHLGQEPLTYSGQQLRSHWIFDRFGLLGDAIVAFIGPCGVDPHHMVDLVDVAAGDVIRSRSMLHFIAEFFTAPLEVTILRQRLLVALAGDLLAAAGVVSLRRSGDDLYVRDRKLSVSIATASAVSTLIHLGINIDPEGAPVPAIGLQELNVEPQGFAGELMDGFAAELRSIALARAKVRPVP